MTPAARQAARRSAGVESPVTHVAEGPNGSLFTVKGGAPQAGSCGYGPLRYMHQIGEAVVDSGVQTGDHHLASALRGLGVYNETKL